MLNISHRQLRAFLLIARLKNFSRAAEQLFIAQSGLSLMIRELEEQLGFRLFNRTTRHVSLTSFGEQLLPIAERNVHDIEAIASQLGKTAKAASQVLTVAAPPMTSSNLLPEVVAAFAQSDPGVTVRIVDTDISNISGLVHDGSIDLGLGMFVKAAPGVVRTPLFRFTLAVVKAHKSFRWTDQPIRWEALRDQPVIALPAANPLQQLIDRHLLDIGHRQPPAHVVNFIETQLGLAAAGCGVAIVPTTAFANCLHRKLSMQPIVGPKVDLDFYQVRDRARKLPACADAFSRLLKQSFAKSLSATGVHVAT